MNLSETEKKLRDEIAKNLFSTGKYDRVESFHEAELFVLFQREVYEQDKQSDYEEWGGKPPSGTGPMTSKPNEGGSS